jgi:hypothetical protein
MCISIKGQRSDSTYVLVDENKYYFSSCTSTSEYSIYFFDKKPSDKQIQTTVKKINLIYNDQDRCQKENKRNYDKGNYEKLKGLTVCMKDELEKTFRNRKEFDEFDKQSRQEFENICYGDTVKVYKYDGNAYYFSGKSYPDLKKYILIKRRKA